jgi:hypothetical protein
MNKHSQSAPAGSLAIRRKFLAASGAALLLPPLLAACGGGDTDEPSITLFATISSGSVGAVFSLSAEAEVDDELDVSEVTLYRVTSNSEILLATFTSKPYLLQTSIPDGTAGTSIEYLARVTDSDGQTADSAKVTIAVNA